MPRIVSLIASATEIVAALGCADQLVGRSHECDYPAAVRGLPVCTEPKFNTEGTSYQIDQRVKAILQEGLSVYRVDAERLRQLHPDVIVTQAHCEVCAVSLRDVEQALCDWTGAMPALVSLHPDAMADLWSGIQSVADALGVAERGRELCSRLQARMTAIAQRARALPQRPSVACIEWIEPLMAAGNWMPELVEQAGGVNLFGAAGQHSPWLTWAELCTARSGCDPGHALRLRHCPLPAGPASAGSGGPSGLDCGPCASSECSCWTATSISTGPARASWSRSRSWRSCSIQKHSRLATRERAGSRPERWARVGRARLLPSRRCGAVKKTTSVHR